MSEFADAIDRARRARRTREHSFDTSSLDDGPEVQLSVRVPEGLRSAIASTAAAEKMSVTAFVDRALRQAVIEANDSFAGLDADLSRRVHAEIRSMIDAGAYREVSAEVDREESWS